MLKKIISGFLISLLLISPVMTKEEYLKYHNSKANYSINYPADWELYEETKIEKSYFTSKTENDKDQFREEFEITFDKTPGYTFERYYKEKMKQLETAENYEGNYLIKQEFNLDIVSNFKTIGQGEQVINGKKAKFIVYTYIYRDIYFSDTDSTYRSYIESNRKAKTYFLFNNKKSYHITLTATPETFEHYQSIFDTCVNSFVFK